MPKISVSLEMLVYSSTDCRGKGPCPYVGRVELYTDITDVVGGGGPCPYVEHVELYTDITNVSNALGYSYNRELELEAHT